MLLALRIFSDDVEKILSGYQPGENAPSDFGLLHKMNAQYTICDSKPERAPVRRLAKRIPHSQPHDYAGEKDREKEFEGET